MLQGIEELLGFTVRATDGDIGRVQDVYFDDEFWAIRYIVVETNPMMQRRSVLLPPVTLKAPRWQEKILPVSLTKEKVRKSPTVDTDRPVSRQMEADLAIYYAWPTPGGAGFPGGEAIELPADVIGPPEPAGMPRPKGDPNLRSSIEVIGYRIRATDGLSGSVSDLLISDTKWLIRSFLVTTRTWFSGKKVLITPEWVDVISWEEKQVKVALTRQGVRERPSYTAEASARRKFEMETLKQFFKTPSWK